MSFTEDELQAFNSILEQRLNSQRQEMEQVIEQRLASFLQHLERQFAPEQTQSLLEQRLTRQAEQIETTLARQLEHIAQSLRQENEQNTRKIETVVDRMFATQLAGVEQLLNQHKPQNQSETDLTQPQQELEAIEVQTELSWEDLVAAMGKALDERLVSLNDSLQHSVKSLEQYLTVRLHNLRDELTRLQGTRQTVPSNPVGNGTSIQEVLSGIEHLERVMESMQVAMTANHALLSNRLYHHQQLPLERAHPNPMGHTHVAPANGVGSLIAQAKEQLGNGLEPASLPPTKTDEDSTGQ